ncbi:riboflavin synthase [Corynebacterium choanae]|uniref:Riboflavin synthase n=1 Tax=Corynebacterium choanae TaxID=1862358 RepID=A0A3G6J6C3_9CORY|nr:riboflavin synthase [Corynebacterium choanae]AZA13645.1 Riboflavin synthase [Corynebacterium choanae]
MFTGIVHNVGTVKVRRDLEDACEFVITAPALPSEVLHGNCMAVNGCCLTVSEVDGDDFTVLVMLDTLSVTNLKRLSVGDKVNLENPLTLATPLGGHMVQGFVDIEVQLLQRKSFANFDTLRFGIPDEFNAYIVNKGPVALDGVSLTVFERGTDWFEVSMIPMTLDDTIFGELPEGAYVNLEVDLFAKYVESMLAMREMRDLPPQSHTA